MQALVLPYGPHAPRCAPGVFLAPSCSLVGDVELGPRVSIWYAAVVRGDVNSIRIGAESNVQDGAVLHGTLGEWPVVVGARVSIGHHATLHGCVVEDGALIGIGARVLDGARIGAEALVAAGALVREGMRVPPRSLVVGVPGVVKRELTERELEIVRRTSGRYTKLALDTRAACLAAGHADPFVAGE
ncbi:MAG: gamma carbonic anhydrase family protein [Planctomycetes bacterium]|nr:gamma carbonic anhydrase family protein [Planctomycetota bacterium]